MNNKKNIIADMYVLNGMKTIVESYEEIAAMRMRKVKKSVLQNRDFLSGLNDIHQRVLATYKSYADKKHFAANKLFPSVSGNTTSKKDWLPLVTNGKTVSVLLSSNTGLYGDIVKRTFSLFADNVFKTGSDIVIVGRIGKQLFEGLHKNRDYKFFNMSDNSVDINNMGDILDHVLQYTNIIVYHGIYVSMLSQDATRTLVTGKALDLQKDAKTADLNCIIEPSIEEVTSFFEKQILSSIFEQSVFESSLSKFASRMVSLDIANENISHLIVTNKFKKLKIKHMEGNTGQLERMSGISLWM